MTATTTNGKPAALPVLADNIPAKLKARGRHFVCWCWVRRKQQGGEWKWTKPPFQPKSMNPTTWCTFDEALAAYRTGEFDGIGYVFGKPRVNENGEFVKTTDEKGKNSYVIDPDDIFGVDLDHCRDPETGNLLPWSAEQRKAWAPDAPEPVEVAATLKTYCEISPSGTGAKLIAVGKRPDEIRKKAGDFESYDRGRYWTLTGHVLDGSPATINDCNGEAGILLPFLGRKTKRGGPTRSWSTSGSTRPSCGSSRRSTPSTSRTDC